MKERVVVTGMGVVSPLGNHLKEFWEGIKGGQVGINSITAFDSTDFPVKIAAAVKNFDPAQLIDKKEAKRMDRFTQFAVFAAKEGITHSGLDLEQIDHDRFGVVVGSGIGGISTIEQEYEKLIAKGPKRVSPFLIPMIIGNMAAGNIAIQLGAKGVCSTVVTACASGTNAIGEAFYILQRGDADVIVAGGAEASITPLSMAGFSSLTALSTSEDPQRASIPFDRERNGFVMGEGAGMLIMETLSHAQQRGAVIYGEVVGYGTTCDAYHITAPAPGGIGGAKAMALAIKEAAIDPGEIGYINAHGTSTPYNDRLETEAIKAVFGENAYKIPISSTKSMTGHLLGAAGAVEAIVCIKAMEEGFIPPTIGLQVPDPDCDLDYEPNEGRSAELGYSLSNSLGFGGHNATLVFKKWAGQ